MEAAVLNVHYVIHIIGFHVTFNETYLHGRPAGLISKSQPSSAVAKPQGCLGPSHTKS